MSNGYAVNVKSEGGKLILTIGGVFTNGDFPEDMCHDFTDENGTTWTMVGSGEMEPLLAKWCTQPVVGSNHPDHTLLGTEYFPSIRRYKI